MKRETASGRNLGTKSGNESYIKVYESLCRSGDRYKANLHRYIVSANSNYLSSEADHAFHHLITCRARPMAGRPYRSGNARRMSFYPLSPNIPGLSSLRGCGRSTTSLRGMREAAKSLVTTLSNYPSNEHYVAQMKAWGTRKYLKKYEWRGVLRKYDELEARHVSKIQMRFLGEVVPEERIKRARKQLRLQANQDTTFSPCFDATALLNQRQMFQE